MHHCGLWLCRPRDFRAPQSSCILSSRSFGVGILTVPMWQWQQEQLVHLILPRCLSYSAFPWIWSLHKGPCVLYWYLQETKGKSLLLKLVWMWESLWGGSSDELPWCAPVIPALGTRRPENPLRPVLVTWRDHVFKTDRQNTTKQREQTERTQQKGPPTGPFPSLPFLRQPLATTPAPLPLYTDKFCLRLAWQLPSSPWSL